MADEQPGAQAGASAETTPNPESQPSTTTATTEATSTPATEAKPADGAPESLLKATGGSEPKPAEGADEPFSIEKFQWPEGINATDADKAEIAKIAAEHKVSTKVASAFVNMHAGILKRVADEQAAEWNKQVSGYAAETRKHFGDTLDAAVGAAEKVLDEFGDNDLRAQLVATGLGNHKSVISFFEKIAKAVGEGTPVPSSGAAAAVHPLASLYPTMVEKK